MPFRFWTWAKPLYLQWSGCVAQLVEQLTLNQFEPRQNQALSGKNAKFRPLISLSNSRRRKTISAQTSGFSIRETIQRNHRFEVGLVSKRKVNEPKT